MGIPRKSLIGQHFGLWEVIGYSGNSYWKCRCTCGVERDVFVSSLKNGNSKSCNIAKNHYKDIIGKIFGEWLIIDYDEEMSNTKGRTYYICECSCGNVRSIRLDELNNGSSKSCGHDTTGFKDITGQQFGEWTVIKYMGKHQYLCICSCNETREVRGAELRNGNSKSCGHASRMLAKSTVMSRYGDMPARIQNPRQAWQIDILDSSDKFKSYINTYISNYGIKPTVKELSHLLDSASCTILNKIHKYELENDVNIYEAQSQYEIELFKFISSLTSDVIRQRDKEIIYPYELDIYIPSKKLAIEFNGTYWHSSSNKHKNYHKDKTIACAKKGIRLIHIFEYEWINEDTQRKIKNLLYEVISNDKKFIYARDTDIRDVNWSDARDFENMYHIQGESSVTSINIGLHYNNDLIGIMTFGKPRFNNNYEYELIRLCWKPGIAVVGGIERLFKYFLTKYEPVSIISYIDIAKFKGNSYLKLGFKPLEIDYITEPNYVWVEQNNGSVLSRYDTQKQKLIDAGLGHLGNTEREIMENLNYYKIYDSGNLKLEWLKGDNNDK